MSGETIPLAKGFNEGKLVFPGYLSIKLDGVPVRLDLNFTDTGPQYVARSRQGNEMPSCEAAVQSLITGLTGSGFMKSGQHTFVGELTHQTVTGFKDVNGIARRQSPQEGLIFNLFDYVPHRSPLASFQVRTLVMEQAFTHFTSSVVQRGFQYYCATKEQFDSIRAELLRLYPCCEGLVYRAANDVWAPGTRRWGYMKIVVDPTVDLKIVGFEEAVCGKTGAGKGMVGRIIADYKGTEIGIGPGKLSHKERKELWTKYMAQAPDGSDRWPRSANRIATIKYKSSPDYTALRQPTFQHWRDDKTEPSYE